MAFPRGCKRMLPQKPGLLLRIRHGDGHSPFVLAAAALTFFTLAQLMLKLLDEPPADVHEPAVDLHAKAAFIVASGTLSVTDAGATMVSGSLSRLVMPSLLTAPV